MGGLPKTIWVCIYRETIDQNPLVGVPPIKKYMPIYIYI